MTKPADSDQIAKARRFWNEWCGTNGIEAAEGWLELTPEQARKFAIAFAASERQAVIEECCRAVCHHCRAKSEKYITRAKLIEGKWIHEEIGFERERGGFDCYAAAIRSME